jgi:uncharacterized OB-fold protein
MAEYTKPLPRPEDPALTKPFWEATKRGELIVPRCRPCSRYFWPPRQACPQCLTEQWDWTPVSGRARLYSYTVVRQPQHAAFEPETPYAYAIVELEEGGVRMISNVVGCTIPDDLAVDMPLVVTFEEATPEWTLFKFRPA